MNKPSQSMMFIVKYHGATNSLSSRISIENSDISHRNNYKPMRKYFNWNYSLGASSLDQALHRLNEFNVITYKDRHKEFSVILVEWDWEKLCKFFGVSHE